MSPVEDWTIHNNPISTKPIQDHIIFDVKWNVRAQNHSFDFIVTWMKVISRKYLQKRPFLHLKIKMIDI